LSCVSLARIKIWMHHYSWNSASIGNMYSVDYLGYQQ
jgi:hypothetical protein